MIDASNERNEKTNDPQNILKKKEQHKKFQKFHQRAGEIKVNFPNVITYYIDNDNFNINNSNNN